ncbi:hypothetical protein DM02DRAFT_674065 [Periconia macrospinosa]|uniref:Uncharacterized protein n=1 Tax=Periconia macrospinosa TaxID=97972 RepID=A0A2V1DH56_9PLEO|nr:hypothetical protein DM02DRAFT_674065 [Periconia macrospinosa]
MDQFLEEKLRLALTGAVPGAQIDSLITTLATLFRKTRPTTTPSQIFLAISAPTVCGEPYCHCSDIDNGLDRYNISIFIDRREQGRSVATPWVRASSTEGYEDAVGDLMVVAEGLIKEKDKKDGKEEEKMAGRGVEGETVAEGKIRSEKSATCLVEIMLNEHAV